MIGGALWTRTLSVNWRQADKKRDQSQQNLVSFGSRGGALWLRTVAPVLRDEGRQGHGVVGSVIWDVWV